MNKIRVDNIEKTIIEVSDECCQLKQVVKSQQEDIANLVAIGLSLSQNQIRMINKMEDIEDGQIR